MVFDWGGESEHEMLHYRKESTVRDRQVKKAPKKVKPQAKKKGRSRSIQDAKELQLVAASQKYVWLSESKKNWIKG